MFVFVFVFVFGFGLDMPHSTEVGQSGPPHRMETFASERPGLERMKRIALMASLLTPTMARILTLPDIISPKSW